MIKQGEVGASCGYRTDGGIYIKCENLEINLKEVEPHISVPNSKYGYKKETIYYFDVDMLVEL